MAITLRIGTPVEGMDFYGRKKEIELAQRRLQGNNLMLAAPRRVGKTSFAKIVMQKMGEQSWNGVFVDLEGLTETSAFFTTIHKELLKLPCIEKSQKIKEILRDHAPNINFSATISGVEAKMAMTKHVIDGFSNLQNNLQQLPDTTLIVLDEITVYLESLLRQGEDVVRSFLNQFRALRQNSGDHCRWIIASSIGVRNFASLHHLSDTLNDFADFPLGAYTDEEAKGLVSELAQSEGFSIDKDVTSYLLSRIGWPIPYFIQLVISRLTTAEVSMQDIDIAYEGILQTTAFETWSERLSKEYGENEPFARLLLNFLSLYPEGKERLEIWETVKAKGLSEERFSTLLATLENDGYIGKSETVRFFRSPLLRDYWKRKFCE